MCGGRERREEGAGAGAGIAGPAHAEERGHGEDLALLGEQPAGVAREVEVGERQRLRGAAAEGVLRALEDGALGLGDG